MPRYRFRWDSFDNDTVKELVAAFGFNPLAPGTDPRSWLADKVKRPNNQFVRRTLDRLGSDALVLQLPGAGPDR